MKRISARANPASEADSAKYHSRTWGKRKMGTHLAANLYRHSAGDSKRCSETCRPVTVRHSHY